MAKEKADPIKSAEQNQAPAEEVLHQDVMEILRNISPEQLITVTPGAEVVKGTAYRSAAWVHGPASLELLAVATKRLNKCASLAGMSARQVEKVQPILIKGTKLLVLKAAPADDMTAISVSRYSGGTSAWINLISLLGPEGITVETHWKERFDVNFVPKSSPLWPGLLIDLSQPKERKSTAKKEAAE